MTDDQDGVPETREDQIKRFIGYDEDDKTASLSAHLIRIPNFGLWNPSIKEAAELVVVDMWFSGVIEGVNEPEDFEGDGSAPSLIAALADTIAAFEVKLSAAVDSGRLEASFVQRNLDEEVIPEETHIKQSDLLEWLEERDYRPGDHWNEWEYTEVDICDHVIDEVILLRAARRNSIEDFQKIQSQGLQASYGSLDESERLVEVQAALKAKYKEIFLLKEKLAQCQSERPAKVDRPLHIRQRRTLLTIIAALCNAASIDYTERGASQRIKSETELVGAPIDDGTIIKFLKEIPEAMETRMK